MTVDFDTFDYMSQLRKVGLRPSEKLVQRIVGLGESGIDSLLALATDSEALCSESQNTFAPIHALRLLGELKDIRIIEPLLSAFPMDDEDAEEGSAPEMWDKELPQILGSLGAPAIEVLWAYADDENQTLMSRSAALISLAYVTVVAPEEQAAIVQGLRERLAGTDKPEFAGYLLIALGNIGAPESYADVMALYKAGKIDKDIIGPGAARQLLLSSGEKRLACAKHPLWERYDQHGPFQRSPYS